MTEQEKRTNREIERIRDVVGTLIAWTAQSANSPLSRDEAILLIERLKEPR